MALDIRSRNGWPVYALSNFYHNSFVIDGVSCRSMEGFIQSLKCSDPNEQIRVYKMRGKRAKQFGQKTKNNPHYNFIKNGVFWNGVRYDRMSDEYQGLIHRAYRVMFEQCPKFRDALADTGNKKLFHTIGNANAHDTILTEKEFCSILTELRKELYDKRTTTR
ncbi:MAG: hypothetical protein NC453_26850 [Muribaculum sp.]|nr:hypothetical protein [Muribaculum sp.]